MEALGTRITTVISGGDGAKRANGKESSGEPTKALASPSIPVALPMTSLCRGAEHFPPLSGSRLSPDLEQHGGVRKACLPQDGHRAELRLDPEETSLSSISIRALRSQLLGRTQRPIQEVCSSESQQMSRGAQERGGEVAQRLAPAPLGPASGQWAWRAQVCSHGQHSLCSLEFLSLMVVQGMEDTSCHGWD